MIIYIIVAVFKVTWGLFCEALPVLRQKKGKEKETDFLNTVCILCLAHLQKCSVGGRLLMKNIFSTRSGVFVVWCENDHLQHNFGKTKELVVD